MSDNTQQNSENTIQLRAVQYRIINDSDCKHGDQTKWGLIFFTRWHLVPEDRAETLVDVLQGVI